MQTKSVTIRVRTLDGLWETIGSDRLRGVWPENDSFVSDKSGPATCRFDLHRDPGAIFPDLTGFTPIEVDIGGVTSWSGFIRETPVREADKVFGVQGLGWQFHLDDDVYQRVYVATRLADFKDSRSLLTSNLDTYRAAGNVSNDRGLVIGWGQGENIRQTIRVGATYDAGAGNTIAAVLYEVTYANGHTTAVDFKISGTVASENPAAVDAVTGAQVTIPASTAETVAAINGITFSSPVRYVHVFLQFTGADTLSAAGEIYARLRSISLFADSAYTSGGVSILTSDIIINDALDRATILLSPDRTAIQTPSFAHPTFSLDGQKTPREVFDAANAVMDWRLLVDVNRRVVFEPRPSAPRVEIGAWAGSQWDAASENSTDDIYSGVIVEGNGPDGEKLSVSRTQGQQAGVTPEVLSSPAPDNPSFATNTTSWTASSGTTLTRDTGVFDTSPASGRWDRGAGLPLVVGDTLTETFTGTFTPGTAYVLTLKLRGSAAFPQMTLSLGGSLPVLRATTSGAFTTVSVVWIPIVASSSATLVLTATRAASGFFSPGWWYIDSLVLSAAKPTLVERRGFKRTHVLPIKNVINDALGVQIGDTWLAAHKTTPLKGTIQITGDRGCREILTGAKVPPERLLLMTGELIRLSHRTDPDTGGHGRDGRIAQVEYSSQTDTATVAIDSTRGNVEALLERMAVVIGSG
jgi:hypothetical protein